MPAIRYVKSFPYVSDDAPFVEVEITFGENLATQRVTLSKKQIDLLRDITKKAAFTQAERTTAFFFDYHIFPDNETIITISDVPIPENWWVRDTT